MLYINPKERSKITVFRTAIYDYIKKNRLRYSDQRERVLKLLYDQSYPVSIEFLAQKLNEEKAGIGYATVARHMKFFEELELVIVVKKTPKGFLLKKDISCDDVEVLQNEFAKR